MKTYNNRYKGFIIHIEEVNDSRVNYSVLNPDKSIVEDTDGYCVTVDEAMDICKDTIDDFVTT